MLPNSSPFWRVTRGRRRITTSTTSNCGWMRSSWRSTSSTAARASRTIFSSIRTSLPSGLPPCPATIRLDQSCSSNSCMRRLLRSSAEWSVLRKRRQLSKAENRVRRAKMENKLRNRLGRKRVRERTSVSTLDNFVLWVSSASTKNSPYRTVSRVDARPARHSQPPSSTPSPSSTQK